MEKLTKVQADMNAAHPVRPLTPAAKGNTRDVEAITLRLYGVNSA